MTDKKLIEAWDEMSEEERKDLRAAIITKISDACGETGKLRLGGKISWTGYKRVMDEYVNQNPALRLYLQGKLK